VSGPSKMCMVGYVVSTDVIVAVTGDIGLFSAAAAFAGFVIVVVHCLPCDEREGHAD